MNKFKTYSLILFVSSTIIIVLIIIFAKEVDNTKKNENISNHSIEKIISKSNDEIELEYIKELNKISDEYQLLLNDLSDTLKDENTIPNKQNSKTIDVLNDRISKLTVPKKYKNFHLLFSRSLLKLSTYINTTNPADVISGVKLYEEAMDDYDKLNFI